MRILVETDFLFGLRVGDKLYPYVSRVLEAHRARRVSVVLSSVSPIEAALVLLSRGFDMDRVIRALRLMGAKLSEFSIEISEAPSLTTIARALEFRSRNSELTLFDSLHIVIAESTGIALATSDRVVKRVGESEGIRVVDYTQLLEVLEREKQ